MPISDPDGEGVEEDEDYRQHMKRILKKRLRLQPVCLNVSGTLEPETLRPSASRSTSPTVLSYARYPA